SRHEYLQTERSIFYVNENANFAYSQSLLARYKDQIQQMKLAVYKSNSISVLNEISDQVLTLSKQITRLDAGLKTREKVMEKHIAYLSPRKNSDLDVSEYLAQLSNMQHQYQQAGIALQELNKNLST